MKDNLFKFFNSNSFRLNDGTKKIFSFIHEIDHIDHSKILNNFSENLNTFFIWQQPSENYFISASEPLVMLNGDHRSNSNSISKFTSDYKDKFINNWNEFPEFNFPLILGAAKFSTETANSIWNEFDNTNWFIPQSVCLSEKNRHFIIFNFILTKFDKKDLESEFEKRYNLINELDFAPSNGSASYLNNYPEFDEAAERTGWNKNIEKALDEIKKGTIKKVVISREVKYKLSSTPSINYMLKKFRKEYPGCYIFAFRKGSSLFIGASPEKLIKLKDGLLETDALAGSIRRGIDANEDLQLEKKLKADTKNIHEFKTVVNFIIDAIIPFCDDLHYAEDPNIRKLPNIQHLWTQIKGKLKSSYDINSLLNNIHPTPAVGGVPKNKAIKLIQNSESHQRGLFSGVTGWLNFNNEGEFAVAIRSALIKDNELFAYAGCGIVTGSNPDDEFEETKLKLKPILSIFENEKILQS